MTYEIVPCRLSHIRRLARDIRADDRAELEGCGLVARHALQALWRRTPDPKCAVIGGDVAAAWGDHGGLLDPVGLMWFFTTPAIERIPLAFFREARRQIDVYLQWREALIADVGAEYDKAIRFFRMLGFEIGEPRMSEQGTAYRRMRIER